ncbi:SusC/RagA family TonB-linked outer membrane protein [Parabacteroides sp. AM08-6]|uniref:SusC/RagA family TonB-linked outer membrane protein n=1 Tax=Parabacteroides sp. AM08-6 TaxID=2292053 RepID=UPI000EFF6294|nr:SusC/RagA family TonB-linked outer membrane protein [Parabacteroides sp. AM08-6]RHJ85365.1 SusC/RagA family TonB-linked outer membrane protein [Parabacteroides sp. AM08-6]
MKIFYEKLFLLFLLLVSVQTYGGNTPEPGKNFGSGIFQSKIKISGRIVDTNENPLAGANVIEKGTTNGVITDANGNFSLSVDENSALSISFIGFKPQIIALQGQNFFHIIMEESEILLDDIIVTALGLEKKEATLVYSAKQVDGEELTRIKEPNMILTLAGKVAGMQVNKTSSGAGSSAKVLMRGIRSVIGNNQPLYVIDGVPILNTSNEQAHTAIGGTADAGNRDGGDGISNLNPEDVENISILKGSPAAALYGSQAANGVILITTKRGSKDMRKITFSTNLTFDKAYCLPKFQNRYGESNQVESWGDKQEMPVYDNAGDFFKTGLTSITSLSVSTGNSRYQTYFSYANTTGTGIIEHNKLNRHNINFRETSSLFNDRLKLDANVNLARQTINNRNPSGGFYMNALVGLYRFPRGKDISEYKNNFEVWDASRNLNVQNWHSATEDFEQNPYWVINRIQSKDVRNRTMASLSADLRLTDYLKIQARGSIDNTSDKIRQKFYASTAPALAGENGRYIEMDYEETMFYGDIMGMFEKKFGQFSVNAALGASINDKTVNSLRYDSKIASLKYANVFNITNINMDGGAYIDQQIDARRQLQSLFATAQINYRESLIADLTARNDWSSTLAYTPNEKSGFFYPSVGAAWIINKMLPLPTWISFSKIRAVWSKVGNDIPLYVTNPVSHVGAGGEIEYADAAPFEDMKPEMTTSVELGTEWRFFNNQLSLSATWYKTNTRNQFFKLPAKSGDKYAYRYVNAGDIQNKGWEVNLTGQPFISTTFNWKSELNLATNKNKVISLHEELPVFVYGPSGFSSSYAMKLKEGGSFGDIYGKAFRRDSNGKILYETEGEKKGLPQVEGEGNLIKVGNCNPKLTLSWQNTFSYKNMDISFLIDCRFGGDLLSQTQADMDLFGVTKETADARDAGYIMLEGHKIEDVEGFYKKVVAGRAGVTEYYMYDATNIRLRECSLGYRLPDKWIAATKVFSQINCSFVARNLFFLYKKAPFDPDLILSTGNDNQGIEVYGVPTTRSFGFNIKCEF